MTVTLPGELVDALGAAAREDGITLSRLVAGAAEAELRRRAGRRPVTDREGEHGAFMVEELAAVRAEMAAAGVQTSGASGAVDAPRTASGAEPGLVVRRT